MTEFIPHHFEKLKAELLEVSGIKNIIPSDCKALSAEIYSRTQRQLSETTLKRVFGFAYAEFKPSAFTISAIAQYCGYNGWDDYIVQFKPADQSGNQDGMWNNVRSQANKITAFALQTLKSSTGIPYAQTIPRKFLTKHLHTFATEPYTGSVISAPSGYGKTTALCHWADTRLQCPNNDDIVLYFNYKNCAGPTSGHNLQACLLTLLGVQVDNNLFDTGFFENVNPKGNFYLIIDELNDGSCKRNEFHQTFSRLIDIVALYRKYSWFKLILAMQSVTWANNRHLLALKMNNWFTGFMNDDQHAVNVPLFNGQEIALLSSQINLLENTYVDEQHINALGHPLYFQYYYQSNLQHFSLDNVGITTMYGLTTEFVANAVYRGKYNDDKAALLRGLIHGLEHAFGECYIDKIKVHTLLKSHYPAYQELLSSGFLKYTSADNALKYEKHIKFGSPNLLHFAIAEKLIADNGQQLDNRLLQQLNSCTHLQRHRLPVLKWCLYLMAANYQLSGLQWLPASGLTSAEECELILFVSQLIKKVAA